MKFRIILVTIIVAISGQVFACKCNGPGTVKESYDGSTIVVHGKVIGRQIVSFANTIRTDKKADIRNKIKTDKQKLQLFDAKFIFEIKLLVIESFKGSIGDTLTIFTPIAGASCGYKFEMDKEYIVYASAKELHIQPLFFDKISKRRKY